MKLYIFVSEFFVLHPYSRLSPEPVLPKRDSLIKQLNPAVRGEGSLTAGRGQLTEAKRANIMLPLTKI